MQFIEGRFEMLPDPVIPKPTAEELELDREPGDVLALMKSFVGERGAPITKEALDEILHRIIIPEAQNEFDGMDLYADETREKWERYLDVRLRYLERLGVISSHQEFVSWAETLCTEEFAPMVALKAQTTITLNGVEWSYTFSVWYDVEFFSDYYLQFISLRFFQGRSFLKVNIVPEVG